MNFGKLLGAGKSFISGRKSAAYRANRRVYLPQFVSPKNPFMNIESLPTQDELPKTKTPAPVAPVKKAASPWAKGQKPPEVTAGGATARATTWVSKLNPVSMFRNSSSGMDKFVPAVQVELSLEKVKVVHNDLSDADVEIVPMKSRPARLAPGGKPAKRSWEDLGERILKATAL